MDGKLLFVIPIYFRTLKQHKKDYHKKYKDYLKDRRKANGKQFKRKMIDNPDYFELTFQKRWFSWKYTQIIKFIEIRHVDSALKAYIYSLESKHHSPVMSKKIFNEGPKLEDVSYIQEVTDTSQIIQDLKQFVKDLRHKYMNKKYFVDSEVIDNILPLLNLNRMIKDK